MKLNQYNQKINNLLLLVTVLMIFSSNITKSQNNINAFYIGHSLSDGVIDMVNSLSLNYPESNFMFRYQTIPGSPLRWNWQAKDRNDYQVINPFYSGFYHPEYGLRSGNFDVLVLTESVPRYNSIIDDTYQYADSFFVFANNYNPNIQIFLYEVWHCIKSGDPTGCNYDIPSSPWRNRLSDDLEMWESVVDTLNNRYSPNKPVCLIPAGQALAVLHDSIQAGAITGINSINDLFSDDIHLNDIGKYFVACVHFSMIHGVSPEGLTNQLNNMWGLSYLPPSIEQALAFQKIAWDVANNYPHSCLKNTSNFKIRNYQDEISIFPNPADDLINILNKDRIEKLQIYDIFGQKLIETNQTTIDVSKLNRGLYFIKINDKIIKFVKK
ncbi:MAG: T9SS type A sorting domain-containing protein [Candidatus Kapabacteria bacterium]|nr:T9SS type A sorting domain-containing protein [Ignavibacteriota bacterium]MCW5885912.1 T9SS type A sorting domain-containing protein [Candidatus Kapabacteria bacterium]